jgi:hypothetical protein
MTMRLRNRIVLVVAAVAAIAVATLAAYAGREWLEGLPRPLAAVHRRHPTSNMPGRQRLPHPIRTREVRCRSIRSASS